MRFVTARLPLGGLLSGFVALSLLAVPHTASAQSGGTQKPKSIFRWEEHPTIKAGKVTIMFRARFQADWKSSEASTDETDAPVLDLAKRRVGVEGTFGKYAEYEASFDLDDTDDPWRDLYLNYSQFGEAQFQYGKFKVPFSVDENTGATNLDFIYRSLAASTLAPGRDRGFMVHGRVFKKVFRYEFGIFDQDGRNARPKLTSTRVSGGETRAMRLSVDPFRWSKSHLADLTMGAAWANTDIPEGYSGVRGHTVFGQKFFGSDYLVNGKRDRMGYEVRWRPGPASFQAEYITMTEERNGVSVTDGNLTPIRATGWYVSGTYAVTGDRKADGLDATKRPVHKGGPGAIELAFRLERLAFDSEPTGDLPSTSIRSTMIIPNADRVTTFGVNWYANRWVKVQFNFIREELQEPSLGPAPSLPVFWSKSVRFQFTL